MAELTTNQKPTNLAALIDLATRTKNGLDAVSAVAASALKSVSVSNGVISFFTTVDGSGTAAFTVSFPEELVLDQIKTQFEGNFAFTQAAYPGATDPNLDGKPVLVVAVKGTEPGQAATTSYSFIDFSALVDTYRPKAGDSAKVLDITGYEVEFKISAATGNALEIKNDGLYMAHQDISGKADKVVGAIAGNIATLDANGNPQDGGIAAANLLTVANIATNAEVTAALDTVFGVEQNGGGE